MMASSNIPAYGLVAHRGLAASFPENTLDALRGAVDAALLRRGR